MFQPAQNLIARHRRFCGLLASRTPFDFGAADHPLDRIVFAAFRMNGVYHRHDSRRLKIGNRVYGLLRVGKVIEFPKR